MTIASKLPQAARSKLLSAYEGDGLWGEVDFSRELPKDIDLGSDTHLAYLTQVYATSGGRDPELLWASARQTFVADPELFDPKFLAYIKPKEIVDRLNLYQLSHKRKADAAVWQRIGQALVMRAIGSVQQLLAAHNFDAISLMKMLKQSKATFLVLSGPQTGPRWLYGLAKAGGQPIKGADQLPIPNSPAISRALDALSIERKRVPAEVFSPLDALGRRGCANRPAGEILCPVAAECPVASYCRYAS